MTRTGDREIRSVSGRLPDNPGELTCMGTRYIQLQCAVVLFALWLSCYEV